VVQGLMVSHGRISSRPQRILQSVQIPIEHSLT
jgi:hypothetical protein